MTLIFREQYEQASNMFLKNILAKLNAMVAIWLYTWVDPNAPPGFLVGDPSFTLSPVHVEIFDNRTVFKFGDEQHRK